MSGVMDESQLFEIEAPPPVSLADKFGVPPMSVLDRRGGDWQDRKRRWLTLGMQSEIGRTAAAVKVTQGGRDDFLARLLRGGEGGGMTLAADGVSVFDPVVCELAYLRGGRTGAARALGSARAAPPTDRQPKE